MSHFAFLLLSQSPVSQTLLHTIARQVTLLTHTRTLILLKHYPAHDCSEITFRSAQSEYLNACHDHLQNSKSTIHIRNQLSKALRHISLKIPPHFTLHYVERPPYHIAMAPSSDDRHTILSLLLDSIDSRGSNENDHDLRRPANFQRLLHQLADTDGGVGVAPISRLNFRPQQLIIGGMHPYQARDQGFDKLLRCAQHSLGGSSPAFQKARAHAGKLQDAGATFSTHLDLYACIPEIRWNARNSGAASTPDLVGASVKVLDALVKEGRMLVHSCCRTRPDVDDTTRLRNYKEYSESVFLRQLALYKARKEGLSGVAMFKEIDRILFDRYQEEPTWPDELRLTLRKQLSDLLEEVRHIDEVRDGVDVLSTIGGRICDVCENPNAVKDACSCEVCKDANVIGKKCRNCVVQILRCKSNALAAEMEAVTAAMQGLQWFDLQVDLEMKCAVEMDQKDAMTDYFATVERHSCAVDESIVARAICGLEHTVTMP
jgi:hypothetical protein